MSCAWADSPAHDSLRRAFFIVIETAAAVIAATLAVTRPNAKSFRRAKDFA
jgi:hypothetical protein